jgi:Inositol hexakisphosphate
VILKASERLRPVHWQKADNVYIPPRVHNCDCVVLVRLQVYLAVLASAVAVWCCSLLCFAPTPVMSMFAGPNAVQTPQEVYEQLSAEGYRVRYYRVPLTDGATPKVQDAFKVTHLRDCCPYLPNLVCSLHTTELWPSAELSHDSAPV